MTTLRLLSDNGDGILYSFSGTDVVSDHLLYRSKSDGVPSVGSSIFSPELQFSLQHRLPPETSVFSVEAWAILQAILLIIDLSLPNSVIFSDSQSVLTVIFSYASSKDNYIIHYIKSKLWMAHSNNAYLSFGFQL